MEALVMDNEQRGEHVNNVAWKLIQLEIELERTWFWCKYCGEVIHGYSFLKWHVENKHKDELEVIE